jgi:formylglycine-generating enzyme required for sulfatase activity
MNYRLPSEAEWEYVCRAGTITPFCFGVTITTEIANYNCSIYADQPHSIPKNETTPVKKFPPNAFGLYDVHGNVWEWCADHWHSNYQEAPRDGSAWIDSKQINSTYVLRGGSWFDVLKYCRSAYRNTLNANGCLKDVGFRVVYAPART